MKTSVKNNSTGLYILGTLYPYITGGMEIFNYYFLNHELKKGNDRIYYLSNTRTSNYKGDSILLKSLKPARLFYPFQFFFAVLKKRKQIDYAYISFAEQSWIISYSQSLVLRLFKIPYIITIHWGKEPEWKFRYPFLQYFRKAHAVVGVSELICSAYKKVLVTKDVQFIPPLIPFELSDKSKEAAKEKLGYSDGEKVILYVGSLKGMKNPGNILQALKKAGTDFLEQQKIRMVFAGGGELLAEMETNIKKLGLEKYVRLEGLVTRENIPVYYKAADCYIISSDYEGTSVSLLEAMYNKLPIIATDAPGINDMVKNERNALLYPTQDTDKLSQCIQLIITNPSLAITLGENAYNDYQEKYSYESMIAKYRAVFKNAVNNSNDAMPMNRLNTIESLN